MVVNLTTAMYRRKLGKDDLNLVCLIYVKIYFNFNLIGSSYVLLGLSCVFVRLARVRAGRS